jgi:predicted DNA-binding transcriptional regulator AlpA
VSILRRVKANGGPPQSGQVIPFPDRGYEPFVGKQQVARHLGRSRRWVEIAMKDHGLPSHPPAPGSNRRRFRLSEIDAWSNGRAA